MERPSTVAGDDIDDRERGRAAYRRRAWLEAYEALAGHDVAVGLDADDLELLATSASLVCRDDDATRALERAFHDYLHVDVVSAARCAIWLGIGFVATGQVAQANGWFGRAQRLLDRAGRDCVERGYLLVPAVLEQLGSGLWEAARGTAAQVAEIGERFAEPDLIAFALIKQGRALVKQGRVSDGLALLDEGMVAVVAGELSSPLLTGLLYCSVIDGCQEVYDLPRAGEWTAALTRWCAAQPELVNFTGLCLVHRSEIMQLRGAWPEALAEARRAAELLTHDWEVAAARYRQGELHRVLGEYRAAEAAYRDAGRRGWQPQPGLALLRLAQGHVDAAVTAISRTLDETTEPLERARLLPACVEVMLAARDREQARDVSAQLGRIAEQYGPGVLGALSAHAAGAVALADDDPQTALIHLRSASQVWRQIEAPYELARTRVHAGLACRALGDDDAAEMELEAARDTFVQLGAAPDVARVDVFARPTTPHVSHGLTARELEVLRLVATGRSNKAIAAELVLSDRTVDRHVSNILAKLGVPSRAAATAYAYQHELA